MRKIKIKQGTLSWEKLRETRIGSSEIFDIVRYYATDRELANAGINAERFREEEPYTTAWALYHKLLADGIYQKEVLAPEFADYGHAVEPYGVKILSESRSKKVIAGEVYIDDFLIASLDVSGVAEEIDIRPYDYGEGMPKIGDRFVCEQKSMTPQARKGGIPFKYIIQAQYQIEKTKADFYILQIMTLKEDTPFIRGRICQMGKASRFKHLDNNLIVEHYYFKDNVHLGRLIDVCIERFLEDVINRREPRAFIENDLQANIIKSIRLNSKFDYSKRVKYNLINFAKLKEEENKAIKRRKDEQQKIVDLAKENNACNFYDDSGYRASFSKSGSLLLKEPEVG